MSFDMNVARLVGQFKKTRFEEEAHLLSRLLVDEEQLCTRIDFGRGKFVDEVFSFETPHRDSKKEQADTWIVQRGPVNEENLQAELRPDLIQFLKKHHSWILHLYLKRPHSPLVLMADEYVTYVRRRNSTGKIRRIARQSGHFSTSVRFPIELHDLLREEPKSLSQTVVDIVATHYKKRRKYD